MTSELHRHALRQRRVSKPNLGGLSSTFHGLTEQFLSVVESEGRSRCRLYLGVSKNGGGATVVFHRIWLHPTLAINVVAGMSCSCLLRIPRLVDAAATSGRRFRRLDAADRRAATAVGPDLHHLAVTQRRTPDARRCCCPGGCRSRLSAGRHPLAHNLSVEQRWGPAARRRGCRGGSLSRLSSGGHPLVHSLAVAQR